MEELAGRASKEELLVEDSGGEALSVPTDTGHAKKSSINGTNISPGPIGYRLDIPSNLRRANGVHDPESWVEDSGASILDPRSGIQDPGSWIVQGSRGVPCSF